MAAAAKISDKKAFQTLVPFNALSPMHFNEVAQKTVVETISAGRQIFKEGDRDNQSVYLLEGEISLLSGNDIVGNVTAGSDASRHPIAQQQPRQVSARAKSNVVVARVDSSLLDIMLTWDQSSGYEVSEISDDDDDDWMTRILQSQAFLKLPVSNIQSLLMRVESVPVESGEVILQQGGEGDYFYIIKNGRCMVTRRPSANAKEVKLAELADGDAFGEDALVSDAKRNATVTMLSDGVLMRLAKKDFIELLKEPLLNKLDYPGAAALVAAGAEWVDVRLPGEYENVHIQGSRNIPLSALRLDANGLNEGARYIICCETGRRSASAAFVLSQRGFDVYVLEEGFNGVPAEAMAGTAAGVVPALSVVANEPSAEPVTLVSQTAPAPVTSAALLALQENLDSLQSEKQVLESEQAQLTTRVTGLQEELERVRDASREEVLELEQCLADTRLESTNARTELQQLKDRLGSQLQADTDLRLQAEVLEGELAERREHETTLEAELNRLRQRVGELDAACAADAEWRTAAQAEQAQFQTQLETLQAQADQAAAHLERIQFLELALAAAEQTGSQTETQQTQRISELELALQTATTALQEQQQQAEEQQNLGQAEYAQAQETARVVTQQLDAARAQLLALEAARAVAMAQLQAQALQQADEQGRSQAHIEGLTQAITQATSAADEARAQHDQAQARIQELTTALAAAQDEQAQNIDAAHAESARLREELSAAVAVQAALATERDELQAAQLAVLETQQTLTAALEQAQARAHELEADSGTQVTQLEAQLARVQEQLQGFEHERENLLREQAQLQQAQVELISKFEQAQARVQSLGAESGEQVQRLEAALAEAQRELHLIRDEQAAFLSAQNAQTEELAAAQSRLNETQAALADAQSALNSLQSEHAQAQQVAADLKASLHSAEQTGTQAETDLRATIESLRAELDSAAAAQSALQTQSEQQLREVEQALLDARAEMEQQVHDAQQAVVAAQDQYQAVQAELAANAAELARLKQQADAASSDDEQVVAQLREQLQHSETQLRESEAARNESAARLVEKTQSLDATKHELEQLQQSQQQAIAQAQTSIRAQLEDQLKSVRSELDGARTALARGMQERGNLEQGLQAEFVTVKKELSASLQHAEATLKARMEKLELVEANYQALNEQHALLRTETDQQQQAWQAELEQLRAAAQADIEATHTQMQRLKEDLVAARKLNAGASQNDELQRLQILLDQAREEADLARAEADRSREQAELAATAAAAAAAVEMAGLNAQQDELHVRALEAKQERELLEQELATLRERLQTRAQQPQEDREPVPSAPLPAAATESAVVPQSNKLWLGMALGLVLGAVTAAAMVWFGKAVEPAVSTLPTVPVVTAPAAKPAAVPKPSKPQIAAPVVAASKISLGREFRDGLSVGGKGPAMIEIAGARFDMGSAASSVDFNERPQHGVELASYAIGKFEVTFAEYDEFARATGRGLPSDEGHGRGSRPVVNVSWDDATAYARWLSTQTGKSYRLPSEAEWEYAAGNVNSGLYWWGSTAEQGRANCYDCGSQWDAKTTAPVGSFVANQLGVFDTAGNVSEWTEDCYHNTYESAPATGKAWVDAGCTNRVVRGGGYNSPVNMLRLTKRNKLNSSMSTDDLGFRVARDR